MAQRGGERGASVNVCGCVCVCVCVCVIQKTAMCQLCLVCVTQSHVATAEVKSRRGSDRMSEMDIAGQGRGGGVGGKGPSDLVSGD